MRFKTTLLFLICLACVEAHAQKKYDGIVRSDYDRFTGRHIYQLFGQVEGDMGDGLVMIARFEFEEKQLGQVQEIRRRGHTELADRFPPTIFGFTATTRARRWLPEDTFIALIDDERWTPKTTYRGGFESSVDRYMEMITAEVGPIQICKMAEAKKVEFRLGRKELELSKDNLDSLKSFCRYSRKAQAGENPGPTLP